MYLRRQQRWLARRSQGTILLLRGFYGELFGSSGGYGQPMDGLVSTTGLLLIVEFSAMARNAAG
jgi:hypothetical protein